LFYIWVASPEAAFFWYEIVTCVGRKPKEIKVNYNDERQNSESIENQFTD